MNGRKRVLTKQIVVRIDTPLWRALEQDADENGRTVAQSVRFYLRQSLVVD